MAMRWLKLDLKRAPNVRKEVDDAIRAYSDAIRSGDKQVIDKLRMAFEARIEQVRARAVRPPGPPPPRPAPPLLWLPL